MERKSVATGVFDCTAWTKNNENQLDIDEKTGSDIETGLSGNIQD